MKKLPKCKLYRYHYLNDLGYVVYRYCFNPEIGIAEGARHHKTAIFITENEAFDYCNYRNRLVDKHGTDALPI